MEKLPNHAQAISARLKRLGSFLLEGAARMGGDYMGVPAVAYVPQGGEIEFTTLAPQDPWLTDEALQEFMASLESGEQDA